MKIKIVCQLCDKTAVIETDERTKHNLDGHSWKNYYLGDFGVEHPYEDYEIWICGACHENLPAEEWRELISNTKEVGGWEYAFEAMKKAILTSLTSDKGGSAQ